MVLLTFAHRGEAQTYIANLGLQAQNNEQNFYANDHFGLLITGEGVYESMSKLGPILGQNHFSKVINIGIAGSLSDKINLEEIYSIRTFYGHDHDGVLFHSYSTDQDSTIDCITSWQRVLNDQSATKLSAFAPLVDREAWGQAKVCHDLKIPFMAYKLISDKAGSQTECFDIKNRALYFSDLMYEKTQFIIGASSEDLSQESISIDLPFHASFTQKKKVEKLSQKIKPTLFHNLLHSSQNIKELIDGLEKTVNPLAKDIELKINLLKAPFENIGAKLHFDPKLENKSVTLSMQINSKTNFEKLSVVLQNYNYEDLENFWQGKLDV